MSQAKVDKYKEEKANRKQNVKKAKAQNFLRKCVVGVVAVILIGWIGVSVTRTYENRKPAETAEIDYKSVIDFQQGLSAGAEE